MIYAIQNQIQDQLDRISNSLRAFSLKLTGNTNDAEDLYQDTALRIITNADNTITCMINDLFMTGIVEPTGMVKNNRMVISPRGARNTNGRSFNP